VLIDNEFGFSQGLSLAEKIRMEDPYLPLILISEPSRSKDYAKYFEAGIDRLLLKPVRPKKLMEAIAKSAMFMFQHKQMEVKDKSIHFLLDIYPNFIVTATKENVNYINQNFLDFLGFSSLKDFQNHKHTLDDFFIKLNGQPYSKKEITNWIEHLVNSHEKDHIVYLANLKTSKKYPSAYLISWNKFPEQESYIFFFTDITELEKERNDLLLKATTDPLTGIFNRDKFNDTLNKILIKALQQEFIFPFTLMMFDIDHFKKINDTYGHQTGDEVLKELALLVSRNIRDNDIFARWGGEEFIILLNQCKSESARRLAERIRQHIQDHEFQTIGHLTCSFGVSEYACEADLDAFFKRVDDAMYRAKKNGRNRVEVN